MKKLMIFVFALCTFAFIACNPEPPVGPDFNSKLAPPLTITSFYPETARSGKELAIFGENFGSTISDNYVTFNGLDGEVLQVPYDGMILVRIPALTPGNYTVKVNANAQTGTCPKALKILEDINF